MNHKALLQITNLYLHFADATTAPGEPDLWSCAAITDEPPEEVAAAGHDRCIIPIKLEHLDAWLQPDRTKLAGHLGRPRTAYYGHRMAA
jgi:putative SOS response-associated peptidase YedK